MSQTPPAEGTLLFVPLQLLGDGSIVVNANGIEVPLTLPLNVRGLLAVYETWEAAKRDYPDSEIVTFTVPLRET